MYLFGARWTEALSLREHTQTFHPVQKFNPGPFGCEKVVLLQNNIISLHLNSNLLHGALMAMLHTDKTSNILLDIVIPL